jgi:hypothetical protein
MNENDLLFQEELDLVNKEIDEIDDLYSEIKNHYNVIKNSHTKGSLTFIEKQTSNLVSIKTAKLNLIKEKINMKRSISEINYKNRQLDNKISSDSNINSIGLESLYAKIATEFKYEKNNNFKETDFNDENFDKEININEDEITELKEIQPELLAENIDKEEFSINENEIVVDRNNNFYEIDNDGVIIKDLGKLYEIKDYTEPDEDGNLFAITTDEKYFTIVDIDEEE